MYSHGLIEVVQVGADVIANLVKVVCTSMTAISSRRNSRSNISINSSKRKTVVVLVIAPVISKAEAVTLYYILAEVEIITD